MKQTIIYISIIFLLTITCSFIFIQNRTNENIIIWSKEYKLKASDFTGTPEAGSEYAANTSAPITMKAVPTINQDSLKVYIYAYFKKNRSWIKLVFKDDEDLMIHEQGHFDIAEIFARKLRRALLCTNINKSRYSKELDSLYDKYDMDRNSFEDRYENETEHSKNEIVQKIWDMKISDLLRKLDTYQETEVIVQLK